MRLLRHTKASFCSIINTITDIIKLFKNINWKSHRFVFSDTKNLFSEPTFENII